MSHAVLKAIAGNRGSALVTVVAVRGSTPRDVGSKMAVLPDGSIVGTVGGGVLEARAIEQAKRCIAEGSSGGLEVELTGADTHGCTPVCGGVADLWIVHVADTGPFEAALVAAGRGSGDRARQPARRSRLRRCGRCPRRPPAHGDTRCGWRARGGAGGSGGRRHGGQGSSLGQARAERGRQPLLRSRPASRAPARARRRARREGRRGSRGRPRFPGDHRGRSAGVRRSRQVPGERRGAAGSVRGPDRTLPVRAVDLRARRHARASQRPGLRARGAEEGVPLPRHHRLETQGAHGHGTARRGRPRSAAGRGALLPGGHRPSARRRRRRSRSPSSRR